MPPTSYIRQQSYAPTVPLTVPGKSPYHPPTPSYAPVRRAAISPPAAGSSVNTSAVPSLVSSTNGDYETSSAGSAGIDLVDLLNDRLSIAVDPLPLDRSLASQAQTSGELNAKHRELLELQALAQRRLKGSRANFADGMKAAKEVKKDLEWTQKRVNTLNAKAEKKYPKQYRKASERFPNTVEY